MSNQGFRVIEQDFFRDTTEGSETGFNRLEDRGLGYVQTGMIVPIAAVTQDQA